MQCHFTGSGDPVDREVGDISATPDDMNYPVGVARGNNASLTSFCSGEPRSALGVNCHAVHACMCAAARRPCGATERLHEHRLGLGINYTNSSPHAHKTNTGFS